MEDRRIVLEHSTLRFNFWCSYLDCNFPLCDPWQVTLAPWNSSSWLYSGDWSCTGYGGNWMTYCVKTLFYDISDSGNGGYSNHKCSSDTPRQWEWDLWEIYPFNQPDYGCKLLSLINLVMVINSYKGAENYFDHNEKTVERPNAWCSWVFSQVIWTLSCKHVNEHIQKTWFCGMYRSLPEWKFIGQLTSFGITITLSV